eukprot:4997799-Alexandrium_andersonii.AAC.1
MLAKAASTRVKSARWPRHDTGGPLQRGSLRHSRSRLQKGGVLCAKTRSRGNLWRSEAASQVA